MERLIKFIVVNFFSLTQKVFAQSHQPVAKLEKPAGIEPFK